MAQKYEIYHETDWDEASRSPVYERLTTIKNEQAAIQFVQDLDNIGKYGNMQIRHKTGGLSQVYNERSGVWENL